MNRLTFQVLLVFFSNDFFFSGSFLSISCTKKRLTLLTLMHWFESNSHQEHEQVINSLAFNCFFWSEVCKKKKNTLRCWTVVWELFSCTAWNTEVCQRLCFCTALYDSKLTGRLLCSSNMKDPVRVGKVVMWQENIDSVWLPCLYHWLTENKHSKQPEMFHLDVKCAPGAEVPLHSRNLQGFAQL